MSQNNLPTIIKTKAAFVQNQTWLQNAHLLISDQGSIVKISANQKDFDSDLPVLDFSECVIIPSFINAHCHLELTSLPKNTQTDFVPWIAELMQNKQRTSNEQIKAGIDSGLQRLARSGVSLVYDHVSSTTDSDFFNNTPIPLVLFGELLGLTKNRANTCFEELTQAQQKSRHPFYLTPHAFHTVEPHSLKQFLQETKTPRSIHLHESHAEMAYFNNEVGNEFAVFFHQWIDENLSLNFENKTPLQWLDHIQEEWPSTLIVHGNHLSKSDWDVLEKHKEQITLVHCPGSTKFFNNTGFSYDNFKTKNIPVALGTDSLASNNDLNFLNEIQIFSETQSIKNEQELIHLTSRNAALALGFTNKGIIREGSDADLVFLKISHQTELLYHLQKTKEVDGLMIQGKIIESRVVASE